MTLDTALSEISQALTGAAVTILTALLLLARSYVLNFLARQNIIGAVERAAGKAILEAAALPQDTLAVVTDLSSATRTEASAYVREAVPSALNRLNVTRGVLESMIQGEIGKQMAAGGLLVPPTVTPSTGIAVVADPAQGALRFAESLPSNAMR